MDNNIDGVKEIVKMEDLLKDNIPEFIKNDKETYDEKRFLRTAKLYRENKSKFEGLNDEELQELVILLSMKIGEKVEDELGFDDLFSMLVNRVKEPEQQSEDFSSFIREYAKGIEKFGIKPDYSVKSLNVLGKYVSKEGHKHKHDSEKATEIIMPSAAYVGEFIRIKSEDSFQWLTYEEAVVKGLKDERNYFNGFVLYKEPEIFINPIFSVHSILNHNNDWNHLKTVVEMVLSMK